MKPLCIPLSQAPELINQVLILIEESFGYEKGQSFEVDFLPLIEKANWNNFYLTVDTSNRVTSCGGFREVTLQTSQKTLSSAFIGGIATRVDQRAQGLGRIMLETLLAKLAAKELVILWSDQISFYEKFGFKEFGFLYENIGSDWTSENTTRPLTLLTEGERNHIISHYQDFHYRFGISPIRSKKNWETIFQMKSVHCSLFPWGYLFVGKGMDLPGIIHEAACHPDYERELKNKLAAYHYWLHASFLHTQQTRFAGLIRPAPHLELDLSEIFIPGVDSI